MRHNMCYQSWFQGRSSHLTTWKWDKSNTKHWRNTYIQFSKPLWTEVTDVLTQFHTRTVTWHQRRIWEEGAKTDVKAYSPNLRRKHWKTSSWSSLKCCFCNICQRSVFFMSFKREEWEMHGKCLKSMISHWVKYGCTVRNSTSYYRPLSEIRIVVHNFLILCVTQSFWLGVLWTDVQ